MMNKVLISLKQTFHFNINFNSDIRDDLEQSQTETQERLKARPHLRLLWVGLGAGPLQVDGHHQHGHDLHDDVCHAFCSSGTFSSQDKLNLVKIGKCGLRLDKLNLVKIGKGSFRLDKLNLVKIGGLRTCTIRITDLEKLDLFTINKMLIWIKP